jgi:hypothetical protein
MNYRHEGTGEDLWREQWTDVTVLRNWPLSCCWKVMLVMITVGRKLHGLVHVGGPLYSDITWELIPITAFLLCVNTASIAAVSCLLTAEAVKWKIFLSYAGIYIHRFRWDRICSDPVRCILYTFQTSSLLSHNLLDILGTSAYTLIFSIIYYLFIGLEWYRVHHSWGHLLAYFTNREW